MLFAGRFDYVPDRLYDRLFQPWNLPESEWPLCNEDWARVDAITRLPWKGKLIDFGCGDCTLSAMVCSRNPKVGNVYVVERDMEQLSIGEHRFRDRGWNIYTEKPLNKIEGIFDGALCCEVLEHMTEEDGQKVLLDLHRALKPGAMLCVTVPWSQGSRAQYPGHITSYTWPLLGKMIREAGFTLDERSSNDILGIWLMAIADA